MVRTGLIAVLLLFASIGSLNTLKSDSPIANGGHVPAQVTATPECTPGPKAMLDLRLEPSLVFARMPVTAYVSGIGIAVAVVSFWKPGQIAVEHYFRCDGYCHEAVLSFPAPSVSGDWTAQSFASGEVVECAGGRLILTYGSAASEPLTLTVADATVSATPEPSPSATTTRRPSETATTMGSATATTSPTSRPSLPLWLPLVLADPSPPPTRTPHPEPSATRTPAPTPDTGRYLLVERWEKRERGPRCGPMLIDFPTYRFVTETGILYLHPDWWGANPRLAANDIGYYGSGASVSGGRGGGAASGLERIVTLPFEADDVLIRRVDDAGAVVVARGGEDIPLAPRSERHWQWVDPGPGEAPGCVITSTLRVTNFGYQDRAKIVYDD